MNILYCNELSGGFRGDTVHMAEVTSALSQMGHKVFFLGGDRPVSRVEGKIENQTPRWRALEIRILAWPLFNPVRSGLSVVGILRHEINIFLKTFEIDSC